jgi:DNA-3-methyladenine glycosylase
LVHGFLYLAELAVGRYRCRSRFRRRVAGLQNARIENQDGELQAEDAKAEKPLSSQIRALPGRYFPNQAIDFIRADSCSFVVNQRMEFSPLSRSFYQPTAAIVARELLGHFLIRRTEQGICGGAIVETEAYLCENDPSCHGAVGETSRNRVMWGEPGFGYVYYIYGNYHCFNTVCRPKGVAEAVLVRAVEVQFGEEIMQRLRPAKELHNLTNGPGKLCIAMDIDRNLDGVDLCDTNARLFVAKNPERRRFLKERSPVVTTTRIGITKAADLPLRFYLEGSPFVSKRASRKPKTRLSHN